MTEAGIVSGAVASGASCCALKQLKSAFLALFPMRQGAICKRSGNKRWFTIKSGSLSDHAVITAIETLSDTYLGCRFGEQSRFAVLDIDAGSPYHNDLSLLRLRKVLHTAGIETTHLYQSSHSGGWHLWIFWDEWASTVELNRSLTALLKHHSFVVSGGVLEVFPSANGLRLPLQSGFAWTTDGTPREQLTFEDALLRFIADSRETNGWTQATRLIQNQLRDRRLLKRQSPMGQSGLNTRRWSAGKRFWENGLTERGQRHDAVLAVEHYLWFGDMNAGIAPLPGDSNDEERERLIVQWLESRHNGKCSQVNKNNWRKVLADVHRACKWRTSRNEHRPYAHTERKINRMLEDKTLTPARFISGNLSRYNYALKRITTAYEQLKAEGEFLSINAVAKRAGAHWNTVRRHWDHLAGSSGDQSPGKVSPPVAFVLRYKASTPRVLPSLLLVPEASGFYPLSSFVRPIFRFYLRL